MKFQGFRRKCSVRHIRHSSPGALKDKAVRAQGLPATICLSWGSLSSHPSPLGHNLTVASSLISPLQDLKGRGSYLRGQGREKNLRQGRRKDKEYEWEPQWGSWTHIKQCLMFKRPQRSYCTFWMFAVLPDHFLFVSRVTGAKALIPQR